MTRPSNTLGYLLQHTAALLAKQNEQVLQEHLGIGMSQFKILRVLQTKANITQREIACTLAQTEASISRQVKLMLDDGLLSSTVSPVSRREHIVVPTTKGIKMTEAALEILYKYNRPTFEILGEQGQKQLLELLGKLHDHTCAAIHSGMPVDTHPKKF
jgi:DNA-binding MarR family transcriptional regulator